MSISRQRTLSISKHPPSKKCPKCKARKPLESFYKNKNRPDGLCSYCKTCKNKVNAKHNISVDARRTHRRIPSEHDYQCHICGIGSDSAIEAERCCMPKRETTPASDMRPPKYGSYAGDQEWKYVRARKLMENLKGLGRSE